jgi:dTDP-4-dehydrorhamnose reductase
MPSLLSDPTTRKLVVTGAHGFVAGSVLRQATNQWQVHAISRGAAPTQSDNLHWHTCDPLEADHLGRVFRDLRPHAVIHTAAIADIDLCQAKPELARAANVEFTRTLTTLCGETGARLIFCSTDTIFDGEHAPYREEDAPGPVNFYAETKVEAERLVSELGEQAVIARLALVYGLPVLGAGNSFLARMIATLKAGGTMSVPGHEVRTPVDVITLGRALLELAAGDCHGILHLAGSSRLNRFDMARTVARRFGFPESLVVNQGAAPTPGRAPRPRDVSLENGKARTLLKTPMRTLDEGLSLILATANTTLL